MMYRYLLETEDFDHRYRMAIVSARTAQDAKIGALNNLNNIRARLVACSASAPEFAQCARELVE